MKRVYLFCDNGMSTSMMAQRMQDVADSHNLPIECKAFSYKIIQDIIEKNTLDCILIGPQTKFLFDEINKKYGVGDKKRIHVIAISDTKTENVFTMGNLETDGLTIVPKSWDEIINATRARYTKKIDDLNHKLTQSKWKDLESFVLEHSEKE